MKRRSLTEWAAIAEIIGTLAVVLSLLAVAYTIERNTTALSRQLVDELYNGNREILLLQMADPDLALMVQRARTDLSSLTENEMAQYRIMIIAMLDVWEKGLIAERDGLIGAEDIAGWNKFYGDWIRVSINRELWENIKWNWNSPELHGRVSAALTDR